MTEPSPIADPTLKQARAEIEAIVRRYGIAGAFVLHNFAPDQSFRPDGGGGGMGHSEVWQQLCGTSYSRLMEERTPEGVVALRVRSKRADFPDAAAQARDMAGTLNMLELVGYGLASLSMPTLQLAGAIQKRVEAVFTPARFQPD